MNKIQLLYEKLKSKHGVPSDQWNLWCKRPKTIAEREEVIIGAILTQNTNWNNVKKAIENLKKAKMLSLVKLKEKSQKAKEDIEELIKPSGFYKQKAQYLLNLANFLIKSGGVENLLSELINQPITSQLRTNLLNLKGIGPETADSILNYALDKPIFVIDAYTKRIVEKEKISSNLSYDYLQKLFMDNLKCDYALFQDFHALIVIESKKKNKLG